jgi:hypothetical protein
MSGQKRHRLGEEIASLISGMTTPTHYMNMIYQRLETVRIKAFSTSPRFLLSGVSTDRGYEGDERILATFGMIFSSPTLIFRGQRFLLFLTM